MEKDKTLQDLHKMVRNLSTQNDILFNCFGRIKDVLRAKGLRAAERLTPIAKICSDVEVAIYQIGMTNPRKIAGLE